MEKIKVTIASVNVFDKQEIPSVELVLTTPIKGFALNRDGQGVESFVETEVTSVSISRSKLTAQLCECNDLIDEYRGCQLKAFDQKTFSLILRKAELTIVRERHTAGEIKPDKFDADGNPVAYQRDCYTTNVVGVKLTDRAIQKLDDACSL